MAKAPTRWLLVGAGVIALWAGCVISQEDLAAKRCTGDRECPAGYRCLGLEGEEGTCELTFPVRLSSVDSGTADAGAPAYYCREVKPILDSYCAHCHGAVDAGRGIRLDLYSNDAGNGAGPHAYRIANAVLGLRMPKDDPAALTDEERDVLVRWAAHGGEQCDQVPYARIQGIFDQHCTGCHAGQSAPNGVILTPDASYALITSRVDSCGGNVRLVSDSGVPSQSMLWRKVSADPSRCGDHMPAPPSQPLKTSRPADFELLERWLVQGANNP